MQRLSSGRWRNAIAFPFLHHLRKTFSTNRRLVAFVVLSISLLSGSFQTYSQNVDMADFDSRPETIYKGGAEKVYSMVLTASAGDADLTALSVPAARMGGSTYQSTDISSFSLYASLTPDFATASEIANTPSTSTGSGETITFSGFFQSITTSNNVYLFIAANTTAGAVAGRTFQISFLAHSDFTFTSIVGGGASLGASGLKKIAGPGFITTWKSDNPGMTSNHEITINAVGPMSYNVYWEEIGVPSHNGTINGINSLARVIDFGTPGEYRVEITGLFPRIIFGGNLDGTKLLTIEQWGTNPWQSMASAFAGCSNLKINANDAPNLINTISLHQMFQSCASLNSSLNHWDVSPITLMTEMFSGATAFNGNIGSWNVSNVTNMQSMFRGATAFNRDISAWNTGNVTNMSQMFRFAETFNVSIDSWDVQNVTNMSSMFSETQAFNQSLNNWNVGNVIDMSTMFENAVAFNGDISSWDVSSVNNTMYMFGGAEVFNQDLSSWDVSSVTAMDGMFANATDFNNDIGGWDVSNVTSMHTVFNNASAFNQNLNSWNVSQVNGMSYMFAGASSFNSPLNTWNVSNVTNFQAMFYRANSFSQNITMWNTSNATDMSLMFREASSFNQNLGGWTIANVSDMSDMFHLSFLSNANYDNTLIGWAAQSSIPSDITLGAQTNSYCLSQTAHDFLTNGLNNWTIQDMGLVCSVRPKITSISPASGKAGDVVTITGTNFASAASDNFVLFGSVSAAVTGGSPGSLTVEVPEGMTTAVEVKVVNDDLGLEASSLLSTTPVFNYTVTPQAVSYEIKTVNAGTNPEYVAVADFNGDGNLDLVANNETLDRLIMRLGNGDGTYFSTTLLGTGDAPFSVATADLNADGLADIISANLLSDDISIYYSLGDGNFNFAQHFVGVAPHTLAFADVNNDGRIDILATNSGLDPPVGTEISILLANGSGGFNAPYFINAFYNPERIITGDFNKDGNIDLAITNMYASGVEIYQGNGTGAFAYFTTLNSGDYPHDMRTADLNNDGNLDLVTAHAYSNNLKVHFGNGTGNFGAPVTIATGDYNNLEVGDFNGDGNLDVASPGIGSNALTIVLGDGAGLFPTQIEIPFCGNAEPRFITSADMNKDGKPDFLIGATGDNKLYYLQGGSRPFVTTWRTTDGEFTFPVGSGTFLYDLTWTNQTNAGVGNGSATGLTASHTVTGLANGDVYRVEMTGTFPHFDMFFDPTNGAKLLSLEQWGSNQWKNMSQMFSSCANMVYNATDAPNLCNVTNMSFMFNGATSMNGDLNSWDVSNVQRMQSMFRDAPAFNGNISSWDVGNVTRMQSMFEDSPAFNQDISGWDVSNVNFMDAMFLNASSFDQNLGSWDIGNVSSMDEMFDDSGLTNGNYDNILIGWAALPVLQSDVQLDANNNTYCLGQVAHDFLTASPLNWTINDAGLSCAAPTVTSFTPTSAATGDVVTITGTDFTGASSVTFGGTSANSFSVVDGTTITAIVANGTSGDVEVVNSNGSGILSGFTYIPPPTISSFTPTSTASGVTVTITGTDLTGATSVSFGGTAATSFTVGSSTSITAVVAAGNSGSVSVTTAGGTATLAGFVFIPAPTISSFTPTSAAVSTTVTITGTNFTGATSVSFGGTAATSFTVGSSTSITAVVANGTSGSVSVIAPGGTGNLAGFTFVPAPTISSFTPTSAGTGATVTITGTNFTGATSVSFGGTAATSFTVNSPTSITALVASGTSGTVEVTTAGGTGSLAGFTFIPAPTAPTISAFTPTTTGAATTVTITGTNFTGATAVSFGGTSATSFTVVSSTTITATVGAGASGNVSVTTPSGTASLAGFTFAVPEIVIHAGATTSASIISASQNITMGSATLPTSLSQTFAINNSGNFVLNVSNVNVTGTGFSVSSTPPSTIAAGATSTFSIQLTSSTAGSFTGTVTVVSNDADESNFSFTVSGSILAPQVLVKNSDDNSGDPITVNQAVDMGVTIENAPLVKTFSIANIGTSPAQVTSVVLSNTNFVVTEQPTTIAPNSFARLTLSLESATPGIYNTHVTLNFTGMGAMEFDLTAEIENTKIEVFNAVTPNGDGAHDFLKIVNIEFYPNNRVVILNRLGQEVFKVDGYANDNPSKRFEGKSNKGDNRQLTDGTYYYVIDIKTNKKYTGFILLQQ